MTISAQQPKTHELKTWCEYFVAVVSGVKTFELRNNDRDFKVDDLLRLREWDQYAPAGIAPNGLRMFGDYTGREITKRITYVVADDRFLQRGFVALGLGSVVSEAPREVAPIVPTLKTAWVMTSGDGPAQKFLFHIQVTRRAWQARWTEKLAEAIRFDNMRACRVMATALGLHPDVGTIEVPARTADVNAAIETGG